jgi:NAD(P)-dependent dehydrogenase (short-subunit alcohol dehydrogenase family)
METNNRKVVVITGGATGLGFAMAGKFIKNQYRTVIVDRNKTKAAAAIKELGTGAESILCDLTELNKLPGLVKEIVERFGKIDVLINNAGVHLKKPLLKVTDEEFMKVIHTNETVVFALSREVARIMIRQKSGSIINISSMAARYGIPEVIAYTAAKSAVEGMTRAMAVELSPHGIRVNCIAPGFIKTSMSENAFRNDPERERKVLSRTPMGKLGLPDDVANAAFFLASDEASYLTGTVLCVDGGNSIGF